MSESLLGTVAKGAFLIIEKTSKIVCKKVTHYKLCINQERNKK